MILEIIFGIVAFAGFVKGIQTRQPLLIAASLAIAFILGLW